MSKLSRWSFVVKFLFKSPSLKYVNVFWGDWLYSYRSYENQVRAKNKKWSSSSITSIKWGSSNIGVLHIVIYLQVLSVWFPAQKKEDLFLIKGILVALQWMVSKYLHLDLKWMKRFGWWNDLSTVISRYADCCCGVSCGVSWFLLIEFWRNGCLLTLRVMKSI